jgi:regulatory protein
LRITNIAAQKKKSRFNVFVDGTFWSGISASALASHNLYTGKEVTETFLGEVFRSDVESRLYDRCIRIIGVRPRSEKEVRGYLERVVWVKGNDWLKGSWYEQESSLLHNASEAVQKKLHKARLLDDDAFAKWWVEQRVRRGMKGWMVIRAELLAKGVSSDLVDRYKIEGKDEYDHARRVYKKFCKSASVTREQSIRRLLSRGFSWDVVKKVVHITDEDGVPMD